MSEWKFCRQKFGKEEFTFVDGEEVTIGRAKNNTIQLSGALISRNHCRLNIKENNVSITDLESSNGIYVGTVKIPQNVPYAIRDSDVIGFGLTIDSSFANVDDKQKFIFKLVKNEPFTSSSKRIIFQSESELDDIEEKIKALEDSPSPVMNIKPVLKRKIYEMSEISKYVFSELSEDKNVLSNNENIINIISDSGSESNFKKEHTGSKKIKLCEISDEKPHDKDVNIKSENDILELEAFNIKQEYLGYDDEPIPVDSDSDSESEHWYIRLSQNSPGKPFTKISHQIDTNKIIIEKEDNSYSQIDDEIGGEYLIELSDEDEDFMTDLITIPFHQPIFDCEVPEIQDPSESLIQLKNKNLIMDKKTKDEDELLNEDAFIHKASHKSPVKKELPVGNKDMIDGLLLSNEIIKPPIKPPPSPQLQHVADMKKIQIIVPPAPTPKKKSAESKSRSSSKKSNKSSAKRSISNSQKEERKQKLKAIAAKKNEKNEQNAASNIIDNITKNTVKIKMSNTNRGAFLSDVAKEVVQPKRKESRENKTGKSDDVGDIESVNANKSCDTKKGKTKKSSKEHHQTSESKHKHKTIKKEKELDSSETRIPLKNLKPLTDTGDALSGKPFSKVEPLPPKKTKKTVRFSDTAPEIRVFEIEPGNKMKKTSSVKTTLLDIQRMPMFSLEKLTLMKVLRWNPQWLTEQIGKDDPPPILGHVNPPMTILHSFTSHIQYVQLVGDLLLMEIWECLTVAFKKIRFLEYSGLKMKIASLPAVPQERSFEISNISVDVSLPTTEAWNLPKVGEILLVSFGEKLKFRRFCFVHNVRCLPSPPRNIYSFYNISLHVKFTEQMKLLRPGEVMSAVRLAHINKELNQMEAMDYLASSPLAKVILNPELQHFDHVQTHHIQSQWTSILNESQRTAVTASVAAALGDKPCIQMVQGPPGTGKSSVISAIVMTYFYNENGNRHQNRAKILITATSNAAVDGLVIKLLKIRQSLPQSERFRMVRVGRLEAMNERARDISSQHLAQREAARLRRAPDHPDSAAAAEEISRLEAKINMWRTAALDAKDPVRVAYCEGRITDIVKRIDLLRSSSGGGGDELRPEQLAAAERRVIERADIIITTLGSVSSHKMKGLKRRIALCIVDEAGQAIEPETLLPLALDVTRLTLVGDPQQLPGYICSQRAKQLGLGESLFSRLSSCAEQWARSPAVLLHTQYRMHEAIADYPARAFYGGRVGSAPPPRPALPAPPYAVLAVASGDRAQGNNGANEMEAWAVSRLASALAEPVRRLGLQLAIITPYNGHKDAIKKNLRVLQSSSSEGQSWPAIEVNTVDSFQGQERDVVLVSLARSQGLGFVADAGRMNVLLTRARHALLVCLNPLAVQKNHQWRTLLEDAQKRRLYKSLPNEMCQAGGPMSNEDILKCISSQS